jgi:hypothetical protein
MNEPATAELRQAPQRPFGVYAIILLFLSLAIVAGLDILWVRMGNTSVLLERVADTFQRSELLSGYANLILPYQLIRGVQNSIMILFDTLLIMLAVITIAGLWLRRRQAWILAMILVGIGLVFNIWNYLEGRPFYLNMLILVVAVFYLNERSVQLMFESRPEEGGAL